jgi:hypothetical protein
LETIEKNGEFESYVDMLADREERERKALRRRDRDNARKAYGDKLPPDYQNAEESEGGDQTAEEKSDWSKETSEEEDSDDSMRPDITDFNANTLGGSVLSGKGLHDPNTPYSRTHKLKSKISKDDMDLAHRFNALRFLAMNLKS